MCVKTKSGTNKFIHDVYYVPGLAHNLLSVGQLMNKGYSVLFDGNICEIKSKKSEKCIQIHMTGNKMFPLEISCIDDFALVANVKNQSWLWHLRYGHLNYNGLELLEKKNMVHGLPHISCSNNICESCVYGKQHRLPFPVGKAWRAKQPLELVHADICGPMNTPSLNKSTSCCLLMITLVCVGYFFSFRNQKHWKSFRSSKHLLRKRVGT